MNRDWCKLLSFAASNGHKDLVALALNEGIGVDTLHDGGKTALVLAAEAGRADVVQLLLMRGARAGALQALTAASAAGHRGVVQMVRPLAMAELEARRAAEAVAQAAEATEAAPPTAPHSPLTADPTSPADAPLTDRDPRRRSFTIALPDLA